MLSRIQKGHTGHYTMDILFKHFLNFRMAKIVSYNDVVSYPKWIRFGIGMAMGMGANIETRLL